MEAGEKKFDAGRHAGVDPCDVYSRQNNRFVLKNHIYILLSFFISF